LREKPAAKVFEVAVETPATPSQAKTKKQVSAEASDQLALPLSGSYDPKLLKEIRQDLLRLKKSLEANP
jgi:hypothetical protein